MLTLISYQSLIVFHKTFQITQPQPNKEKVLFLAYTLKKGGREE